MSRIKYTKSLLEELAKASTSIAQVIRKLGLKEAGGTHYHVSNKLKEFDVDTSHFLGKACNQGANHTGGPVKKEWKEILFKRNGTKRQKTFLLRRALLEMGRNYICEVCGLEPHWNGEPLVLQIDHIDGDWVNDSPENLRFICGNCHSQTNGWCKRKT